MMTVVTNITAKQNGNENSSDENCAEAEKGIAAGRCMLNPKVWKQPTQGFACLEPEGQKQ